MLGGTGTVGYHSSLVEKLNLNRVIGLYAPELPTSRDLKNTGLTQNRKITPILTW